ncbi:MAG TPA: EAL domain-containing protein [Noviherbaspirillum sp.]|jgi:diguanylate cyclase (GGDEF)-like protein|uniref:bifunctional diguanylate cyclase/phosphodiesterase n=1 Tax=Noviherbaspirillum sp. TaxID=1926288 RepID=UPI002F94FD9A
MSSRAQASRSTPFKFGDRHAHLLRGMGAILGWPFAALLLGAVLWATTYSLTERDRRSAETRALEEVASNTRAYAEQLERTVDQVAQVTLELKADVEEYGRPPDLESRRRNGLHPEAARLYTNIIDQNGFLVTSSLGTRGSGSIAGQPYFEAHRNTPGGDLRISEAAFGQRVGGPVVRFSRRIDTPDGDFGGVAMAAIEPSFLAAFHDEALMDTGDFVSVRFANGPLLATKVGGSSPKDMVFYLEDPVFGETAGVRWEPGEKFRDGQARIISWKKLEGYPLVALSAKPESTVFAGHVRNARALHNMAVIGSFFLLLFSLTGMSLSARLAARREQAEEVQANYRMATEAANEGFFIHRPLHGPDGRIADFIVEDCNERGAALINNTREDIIGARVTELIPGRYGQELLALYRRAMETGFHEDEIRVSPPSRMHATWVYRRLVRTGAGLTLTIRDISEAKAHEQALAQLANTDALTTLPNRHWLSNFLPNAVAQAEESQGRLAVLFIDLDNFKNINDTLGHEAGDALLQAAALRLKTAVRASDHVVRLGGDEFTIVLEHVALIDDVARVAKQVVREISEPFTLLGTTGHRVNASIGISMYPQDGRDGETLLKHADIAMYAAKAAGKGRYHFYQSHLSDTLILKLSKEQALRRAVEQDEFVMHYQPRVGAASGRLSSMEALVRWHSPERGLVYPVEFIDLAEDTGMIIRLGELVIEKVCAQIAAWQAQRLAVVPVSINVSGLQLREGRLSSFLSSCLERYGVAPALLEVELTESSMIDRNRIVAGELAALRSLGVKLLIDDFGTGYSSLAQLHRLDVDVLKVDRAFTTALGKGSEGESLFRAIVSMAGALDICVVAEGVETEEQLLVLQSLDCDEVQGHLVSRAVPAQEMPQMMRRSFLFAAPQNPAALA